MKTMTLPTTKQGLHGSLRMPGDKSISHRSIMLGAISEGTTVVDHLLLSDDCLSTINAFRALGVDIDVNDHQVRIQGRGGFQNFVAPKQPLDMGNSGTTTRLMLGLLAKQPFDVELVGDASLSQRPLARVIKPLTEMGAKVTAREANFLPVTIHANDQLRGLNYQMPIASAQVKSALILAGLQASGPSQITEKLVTRDHTERMLHQFDVTVAQQDTDLTVQPTSHLTAQHVEVPGDISSAAFFIVAALCIPNSELTLTNVGLNPTRVGILTAMKKMGATFEIEETSTTGELMGNITVTSQALNALKLTAADIPALVDELPLIALTATQAKGSTRITGAQELRVKETDRIQTVTEELSKMGANIEALPDGFVIEGPTKLTAPKHGLDSHGDHRIGMMLAIASLIANHPAELTNAEAISVSYPNFWQDLEKVGALS